MLIDMGKRARHSARTLGLVETRQKNEMLTSLAECLVDRSDSILAANALDVAESQKAGMSPALLDRLTLNPSRIEGIVGELRQTLCLPDPGRR